MTTEIHEYSTTEAALSTLREKYTDAVFDVAKKGGMLNAKAGRAEIRGYRTSLEKMRKDIKAPALERCRLIDDEAKRITVELVTLESPIDKQIKDYEARVEAERQAKIDAEVKRVNDIQARIAIINEEPLRFQGRPAAYIEEKLERMRGESPSEDEFQEFHGNAVNAHLAAIHKINGILSAQKEQEAEQARIAAEREELKALREAEEKRQAEARTKREAEEREAREKREAEQATERKKLDAERKQIEADRKVLEDAKEKKRQEELTENRREAAAQAAAKKALFPGEAAIVTALVNWFDVTEEVVKDWLETFRQ